jgi:hypothetical protein
MGHAKTFALLAAMGLAAGAQAQSNQDEGRAYAAELLAQSEGRTSTLAQPASPLVQISGQIQFRYVVNIRDAVAATTPPAPAGQDLSTGFQTRRTKLEAKGEVADGWTYFVQLAADPDGGSVGLQEAWVRYQVNENSNVLWGQFKLPLLREELVSSKRQLAVERSIANEVFTQDRSQGIQYGWDGDNIRFRAAFSDGLDTENTDFDTAGGGNFAGESDFALTGRVEYMGAGEWKQFDDFTSWQGGAFAWMIGGAAHFQNGGETNNSFDHDMFEVTVDGSLEGSGWNAFGAFIYRSADVTGVVDADDFAFLAQGGVFVAPQWELFGRFDYVSPDSSYGALVSDDFTTFTFGANYYVIPESHAAKFTADLVYFIDNSASSAIVSAPDTGVGLLPSAEDGEWLLRFQFQLLF